MGDAVFPLPRRRTEPPEAQFQALHGRWQPLVPAEVARLLRTTTFPWWSAGGGPRTRRPERPGTMTTPTSTPWLPALHDAAPTRGRAGA